MGTAPEAVFEPDQLIVDLAHFDLVQRRLFGTDEFGAGGLGLHFTGVEQDADLGLALLTGLTDAVGAAVDVQVLVALLRQQFAAEYDGWVPELAVNHIAHNGYGDNTVVLLGHKPMEFGDPVPATADEFVPARPASDRSGTGVVIGIVDTAPFVPADGTTAPVPIHAGHYTFVESLIRSQAPGATTVPVPALSPVTGRGDSWTVARAMIRCHTEHHADVINLSLGCYSPGGPPFAINRAVERLPDGVLVVCAAGNHGDVVQYAKGRTSTSACWPAALPRANCLAVGAVTSDGGVPFPPFSPNLPWVTHTADGVGVVGAYLDGPVELPDGSTQSFGGYARWSGTSFSAATVSGAVAAAMAPATLDGPSSRGTGSPISAATALAALESAGVVVRRFTPAP